MCSPAPKMDYDLLATRIAFNFCPQQLLYLINIHNWHVTHGFIAKATISMEINDALTLTHRTLSSYFSQVCMAL